MQHAFRIAPMLLVYGALLGWHLTADRLGCATVAVLLASVAALLTISGMEVAFYRRYAFLRLYLVPDGILFRLLGRRILIIIRQVMRSLLLAFLLLIAALRFDWSQWLLLLADVFLLTALLAAFSSRLAGEVRQPYRDPMARHWAGRINAALLWVAWAFLMYYSPQENYLDLRWDEVVAHSAHQTAIGCDALSMLSALAATGEALALWFAQNQLSGLQDPDHLLAGWSVFIAVFGASLLVFFAYGRALVGTQAKPWHVWRQAPEEDPS